MNRSKRFLIGGVAVFALVAGCRQSQSAASDYRVPERWALAKFAGHDFWPLFQPDYWSVTNAAYHADNPLGRIWPPPSVWIDSGTIVTTYLKPVPVLERNLSGGYMAPWKGKLEDVKHPTPFLDFFNPRHRQFVETPEKGERPYFVELHGLNSPFHLEDSYDLDEESFRRWKADHPGFVGFRVLSEFDFALHTYGWEMPKRLTNEVYRARLAKKFGWPGKMYAADADPRGFLEIVRRMCDAIKVGLYGKSGFWSMNSSCISMPHKSAEFGASGLFYEATSQGCGRWQVSGAFLRGASRQYGIPFAWYTATWCNGFTRDGQSLCGANSLKAIENPSHRPFMGAGVNSTRRMINYAWLIGASFMETEGPHRTHYARTDDAKPPTVPSQFALDMEELWQRSRKTDRGVVYSPIAVLTPLSLFMMSSASQPYGGGQFTYNPFFYTLCPILSADGAHKDLRRRGKQSCLFNSKFGEIYDILVPDGKRGDFAAAIAPYKAAFLIGDYRKDELRLDDLRTFVSNGGTLYVGAEQVLKGLIPAEFAGLTLDEKTVESRGFAETYAWHVAGSGSTAKPLLKDAAGGVALYANAYGRGKVVVATAERMLPAEYLKLKGNHMNVVDEIASGKRTFSLIDRLLSDEQDRTMPVRVRGDIQWGINKVERKGGGGERWLLWLINNNGVTKFTFEPEEFDPKAASVVEIDPTRLGKKPFSVTVGPGEIKLIELY